MMSQVRGNVCTALGLLQNYISKLYYEDEIEILLSSTQTGLAKTAARKRFQYLWRKIFCDLFSNESSEPRILVLKTLFNG